jgi:CRISPR-associated endonuclease/helicase Cas3
VFEPRDAKPPRELQEFWQAARPVLRLHDDPLSLEAVRQYFTELYWRKGEEALDAVPVGDHRGILPAIRERAPALDFPFSSIAEAFRIIDNPMEPVIVPWRADEQDRDAEMLLSRIAGMERAHTRDLRRLQQYTVSIPPKVRQEWFKQGVLRSLHAGLGEALLRFEDLAHYDRETGVNFELGAYQSTESNIL